MNYPKITYVVGDHIRSAKQPYITSPVEEVRPQVLLCSVGAFGQSVLRELSVVLADLQSVEVNFDPASQIHH